MTLTHALLILLAGIAAGTINTIVGSGTLVTFPTLLAFGIPAVNANVSNSVGLVAGGVSGSLGYRKELVGIGRRIARLVPMSLLGGITGALLLIWLPPGWFDMIVPALIFLGVLLVVLGPWLQKRAAAAHSEAGGDSTARSIALFAGIYGAGVYGGYFGAAQGVILVGLMSVLMTDPLQRINGIKNVLSLVVNAVAAVVFMIVAWNHIDWRVAGLIALGSLIGGVIGARVGRKLSPWVLRGVIVVIGVIAIVQLLRG